MAKKKLVYTENGLALKALMVDMGWSRPDAARVLTYLGIQTSCKAVDTWLAPVSASCHRPMANEKLAKLVKYAKRVRR